MKRKHARAKTYFPSMKTVELICVANFKMFNQTWKTLCSTTPVVDAAVYLRWAIN